ncbi:uncharacterized protein SOCE836_099840 [Sorangium cellulosum]|uniref:Uncharacterized protein n=1 Tax=Sorangium cellulosum TaxID=56 RepID=A0A4P2R6S5_SORCE|nr:uncharacterized protein SOCE836_099840 [Sorangium cellulosum]WCQ97040.1 hypothetical protein NQZ70_09831 [Sorangium sp. Soce836]
MAHISGSNIGPSPPPCPAPRTPSPGAYGGRQRGRPLDRKHQPSPRRATDQGLRGPIALRGEPRRARRGVGHAPERFRHVREGARHRHESFARGPEASRAVRKLRARGGGSNFPGNSSPGARRTAPGTRRTPLSTRNFVLRSAREGLGSAREASGARGKVSGARAKPSCRRRRSQLCGKLLEIGVAGLFARSCRLGRGGGGLGRRGRGPALGRFAAREAEADEVAALLDHGAGRGRPLVEPGAELDERLAPARGIGELGLLGQRRCRAERHVDRALEARGLGLVEAAGRKDS